MLHKDTPAYRERVAAITNVDFFDNATGCMHDAGWWRMWQIQRTRDRAATLRRMHRRPATLTRQRALRIQLIPAQYRDGSYNKLLDRAYAEYVYLAAGWPSLTMRAAWDIAWHNARSNRTVSRP